MVVPTRFIRGWFEIVGANCVRLRAVREARPYGVAARLVRDFENGGSKPPPYGSIRERIEIGFPLRGSSRVAGDEV